MDATEAMEVPAATEECQAILDAVGEAVIADRGFFEDVLLGILSRGHVLLEDVPGTGKTLTARSLASALGLSFSRIQFTPDLLPSDVTGTHVFNEGTREFEFNEGPIFANVVLADEINRAPPKTQAALLEAMEEGQVTVDGDTHQLPSPFFVIATQNPVDQEGTFPLPEAQIDRFLVKSSIGYPDVDGEEELLHRRLGRDEKSPSVATIMDEESVAELRAVPETVSVDDDLVSYVADIARRTRSKRRVDVGVSPRGTQRLLEAARARATMVGRDYVTPDDVKRIAQPVLAHRLVLTPDARVDGVSKFGLVNEVLEAAPVPTIE
jgi:MoxR-like ATPase